MNVLCHPATDIKGINIVCKEKKPPFEVESKDSGREREGKQVITSGATL